MKRRKFLQKTAAGAALAAMPLSLESFMAPPSKHLTILHTNDVHSYIDPFPPNHPKNPNMGGVARRATLINSIRQENPNVLLIDAGDIFQGTPYFNYYGGELEFKLMSMMGYELSTMGNHDFDNGIDGFHAQMPNAKFEFVSANYDFTNTVLNGIVKPYKTFNKDGIKVGVFGLGVQLEGLVDKQNYKETVYHDPVGISQDMARKLRYDEKCDLVICLSHIGYSYKDDPEKICDVRLAAETKDIDMIIGGHTHTFLDKPSIVKNSAGEDVIVNQAGCYGVNLGRLDVYFENGGKSVKGRSIIV